MIVEAYQREFLNLSRYAEEEITTDARKQQKFRRGLQSDLRLALPFMTLPTSPPCEQGYHCRDCYDGAQRSPEAFS